MPRTARERNERHCNRMIGNLDKALDHLRTMEIEYLFWGKELPSEAKVIAMMLVATQEKLTEFIAAQLRA